MSKRTGENIHGRFIELELLHNDPPKMVTNLNVVAFAKYLKDKTGGEEDIEFFANGFPLSLKPEGPDVDYNKLCQNVRHFARTMREALVIIDTFIKEVKKTYLIPTDKKPKYIINLHCAPKKDTNGDYTALRMVRHGSYCTAHTVALNDIIEPEACTMQLPHLKEYTKQLFGKKFAAMRDLKDAFRQLLLRAHEYKFCGYAMFGMYFLDTRQPYGIAPAAASCQRFAENLIWIFENHFLKDRPHLREATSAHIDDFTLAAKQLADCQFMEQQFDKMCEELNVLQSTSKTVHATNDGEVHGLLWHLQYDNDPGNEQTVEIPDKKYKDLRRFVFLAIRFRIITIDALESLCGKIMHYAQLSPLAKSCIYNLLHFILGFCRNQKKKETTMVILPYTIVRDLKRYYRLMPFFRKATFNQILDVQTYTISAATDACTKAGGIWIASKWAHYPFRKKDMNRSIAWKEMHAVLKLLKNYGPQLSGHKLYLLVDNASVVQIYARKWSGQRDLMRLLNEIILTMLEFAFTVYIDWVSTTTNIMADLLSRGKIREFKRQCVEREYIYESRPWKVKYIDKFHMEEDLLSGQDELEMKRLRQWLKVPPHQRTSHERWWMKNMC